ncbi:MAG: hypothetical protein H7X91_03930 [Burkholderiales bacterium]|nr:hypothetical protein [Burkholderiales bacterium]
MPKNLQALHLRKHLAHLAARLMAEDGIDDFAQAKRKAARQAGLSETRDLPTNAEIEVALRIYRELFQADSHGARLILLRQKAASALRQFTPFNPFLTGPVLSGRAGPYSPICLQLFADNPKSVEIFLLDRELAYQSAESRLRVGDEQRLVPVFVLDLDGTELRLSILSVDDQRQTLRRTPTGEPMQRAGLEALEALLAEDGDKSAA